MKSWMRWVAPLVVMSLALAAAPAGRAQEKAASKGSIAGTVLDADGKAVAGAEVVLHKAPEKPAKQQKQPKQQKQQKAAAGNANLNALVADDAAKEKTPKPEPIARVTTDVEGKFVIKDLAAGDYVLNARLKGTGNGKQKVTVAEGKLAEVKISLTPPKQAEQGQPKKEKQAKKQKAE